MKIWKVKLVPDKVQIFEELTALFELKGVEIINPDDSMYVHPQWSDEEKPIKPEGEPYALLYGTQKVLEEVVRELSELILSSEAMQIDEVDWMQKWSEGFKGMEAGETLFIRPPWIEPREDKMNVVIVPGMAFGTGTHETTRLSASAIEKWIKKSDRVIDVGSGSGVLSLVASALGAESVLAIENDATTFSNAQENLSLNSFGQRVTLLNRDLLEGISSQVDLIVANILPPVLIRLAPQTLSVLNPGGKIILSGILRERASEVLSAYQDHYQLLEQTHMGEWVALVLERVS